MSNFLTSVFNAALFGGSNSFFTQPNGGNKSKPSYIDTTNIDTTNKAFGNVDLHPPESTTDQVPGLSSRGLSNDRRKAQKSNYHHTQQSFRDLGFGSFQEKFNPFGRFSDDLSSSSKYGDENGGRRVGSTKSSSQIDQNWNISDGSKGSNGSFGTESHGKSGNSANSTATHLNIQGGGFTAIPFLSPIPTIKQQQHPNDPLPNVSSGNFGYGGVSGRVNFSGRSYNKQTQGRRPHTTEGDYQLMQELLGRRQPQVNTTTNGIRHAVGNLGTVSGAILTSSPLSQLFNESLGKRNFQRPHAEQSGTSNNTGLAGLPGAFINFFVGGNKKSQTRRAPFGTIESGQNVRSNVYSNFKDVAGGSVPQRKRRKRKIQLQGKPGTTSVASFPGIEQPLSDIGKLGNLPFSAFPGLRIPLGSRFSRSSRSYIDGYGDYYDDEYEEGFADGNVLDGGETGEKITQRVDDKFKQEVRRELNKRAKKAANKIKEEGAKRARQIASRIPKKLLKKLFMQLLLRLSQSLARGVAYLVGSIGWVGVIIIIIVLLIFLLVWWLSETTGINQTAASIERIELYLGDNAVPILEKFGIVIGTPKEGDMSFGNSVNGAVWANGFVLGGPNGETILEINNIQPSFQFKRISDGVNQNIKEVELVIAFPITDFTISNFNINNAQGVSLSKLLNRVVIKCNVTENCNPYDHKTFSFDVKFDKGLNLMAFNNKFMIMYAVNKIVFQDSEMNPDLSRNGIRLCLSLITNGIIGLVPCNLQRDGIGSSNNNANVNDMSQSDKPLKEGAKFLCPLEETQLQHMICTSGFNDTRGNLRHNGIDIAPKGNVALDSGKIPVFSPVTGKVVSTLSNPIDIKIRGGNTIVIKDMQNGYHYVLAHINTDGFDITPNKIINKGERIGFFFNPATYNSSDNENKVRIQPSPNWWTGVHLHFEIRDPKGNHINPLPEFITSCGLSTNFRCMRG